MNPQWVIRSLRTLYRSFHHILEDDAGVIIEETIADVETSKEQYDERIRRSDDPRLVPQPWGYRIDPERPLRFKTSSAVKGIDPHVDVYSTVLWMDEGQPPVRQNTHLRIWSSSGYAYREAWDAPEICDKLTDPSRTINGRVMYRCHFDLAEPRQAGPKHHVQFGGSAHEYELCWFLEMIDIPRLISPPMDLVLVCQAVAANFFWDEYCDFRETPEWRTALQYSQEHLLRDYYKECFKAIDDKRSLLDSLWNV